MLLKGFGTTGSTRGESRCGQNNQLPYERRQVDFNAVVMLKFCRKTQCYYFC